MAQPTRQQQQQQHKDDIPTDFSPPQQLKRKPLAIHPPSPMHIPTSTTTHYDTKPRRSSSISSQTSSIFSQSGPPSSTSSLFPSSPLFRSSYNKLGGSTVGMGTSSVGSMPHTVVGFSPYLGQRSPYGAATATATAAGRRGFASSSSLLLSSHPSSPVVSPASSGAIFTTETRRPFDMDAIDVSESESEGGSIDGNDTSESEFTESEAEADEGDDVMSISEGSSSDKSDSDDDDEDRDDSSGIESPISTYDPTPAANLLSSSAPSPRMMTGRLGLFGGVQQQTTNGDILRRSQEFERHRFSLEDARDQKRVDTNSTIVSDKQATTTALEAHLTEGRGQEANTVVEQGRGLATICQQDFEAEANKEDTEGVEFSMPPSPALSHSPLLHSLQSTTPSSPSLSVSHHPLDSDSIPDTSRLSEEVSSPPSTATASPVIPDTEEQNVVMEPYAVALVDDLLDEGVFEEEEGLGVDQGLIDREKSQDSNSQGGMEADTLSDSYGSLPLYTTHPTPIVQRRNDFIEHDLGSSSSSSSDAVIAELKEVRTMLQDLHRRMDCLEQSMHVRSSPNSSSSTRHLVPRRLSSSSGHQKDKPSSSSPETRRRGILSIIKSMATPQRRRGGGGGGLARIALLVLFFGLILFGRRSYRKKNLRLFSLSSLLGMDWTATAVKQFARSRLGFLEKRVSRMRRLQ
ncbi:hypothetical protein BGZ95_011818 [Linnemannia exigua]|uniref:Uncharacterized protein n=1 Tax=Linnemannia exigua TaxID=604196 RepID=A0AAD4H4X5_9FUNG|nr:hypothetical protein BGZ95_011818 [Linnemannia exigua]